MTPVLTVRHFEAQFIPDILRCLREAYGEDYYRPECYDPEYLIRANQEESLRLLLAMADGNQFAGMIGVRQNPYFEGSFEMSMQVMRKEFRGMGLGKHLLEYAIRQARQWGAVSVYGRSVTFHLVSQNEMQLFGMQGTGLWFGRHKSDQPFLKGMPHSPTVRKLHSFVMAKACTEISPLTLCPPKALRPFVRSVYASFGVSVLFTTDSTPPPASRTALYRTDDDSSDNCDLYVMQAGLDFPHRLRRETASYHIRPLQTYNTLVNMKDPACGFACQVLEQNGFFFTGLHPLNQNAEYLIFHRLPDPDIRFGELVLSPENQLLAAEIEKQYRKKEPNSYEKKKKYSF